MGVSTSQTRVAKAGFLKAAAIKVAFGKIEIQAIDFTKAQTAEILLPSGYRCAQLDEITRVRFHQRMAAKASSC
jgi:hypothetical protein